MTMGSGREKRGDMGAVRDNGNGECRRTRGESGEKRGDMGEVGGKWGVIEHKLLRGGDYN